MGLEFTTIPDRTGPAVYLLGNTSHTRQLTTLGTAVDAATPDDTQVVLLDINSADGAKVAAFYGFRPEQLPVVMIVKDDDTLHHSWYGHSLPRADIVAHHLNQITGANRG